MKKSLLIGILLIMPFIGFGQLLWSTKPENPNKRVTLEEGIRKMMENYDLYDQYSTYMGYTHEQWLDEIDDDEIKQEWIDSFAEFNSDDYELYGSRRRQEKVFGGTALVVAITYIDAEYVSRVTFSNDIGSELTYSSDRWKFERWFRSFIDVDLLGEKTEAGGDQGDKKPEALYPGTTDARALYGKSSGGGGGAALEMTGWMWDCAPDPKETASQKGKIVFEVTIDNRGQVISSKVISYSVSRSLMKIYQEEIERMTFSKTSSGLAPPTTKGVVTIIIKTK